MRIARETERGGGNGRSEVVWKNGREVRGSYKSSTLIHPSNLSNAMGVVTVFTNALPPVRSFITVKASPIRITWRW